MREMRLRSTGLDVRVHPPVARLEQRGGGKHQLRRHRKDGNDAEQPVRRADPGRAEVRHSTNPTRGCANARHLVRARQVRRISSDVNPTLGGPIARLISAVALAVLPAVASGQYKITHTYTVGGDGSWDYVIPDTTNHRLFIGRQNRVMVVDENDGKLIGEMTGIHGAHGVAIAAKDRTWLRDVGRRQRDRHVRPQDLQGTLAAAHAAEDADAIIYDAASNRVFSFNGDAHSSTVVDPVSGALVANIPLGGKPEYGVARGDGKVYANLTDVSEVVEIDAKTLKVTRRWSTAPCKQPVSMAIDPRARAALQRLPQRRHGGLRLSRGKVVATAPIGAGNDGAAYDPATGDAFLSNLDGRPGHCHQDSPDAYRVVQNVVPRRADGTWGWIW